MKKKVIVIGAGPGGYVAAIRSAQLGAETTLVEERQLGGVCLNEGCIPTKVLNRHGAVIELIRRSSEFGIRTGASEPELDFPKIAARKDAVVTSLRNGVEQLLKKNGVKVVTGRGRILSERQVEVAGQDGMSLALDCDAMILATGAEPILPKIPGIEYAVTSRELLALQELPSSMVIIGGGVIGIEIASIFNIFGCKTTVIEMQEEILPGMDRELAKALHKELKKSGVRLLTSSAVTQIEPWEGGFRVSIGTETVTGEKVLAAIGRKPVLPPSHIPLAQEGDAIKVDEYLRTNYENIYCIGDANGKYQLAHVAYAEALVAAENIMSDHMKPMSYKTVPSVVYSFPEVASVGLSEERARGCLKSVFPYSACGKAVAMGETAGFVKVLADKEYKEVLGVHMMGYDASNLIGEAGMALSLEATAYEVSETVHAHPSLSEMLMEACEGLTGKAIHK